MGILQSSPPKCFLSSRNYKDRTEKSPPKAWSLKYVDENRPHVDPPSPKQSSIQNELPPNMATPENHLPPLAPTHRWA